MIYYELEELILPGSPLQFQPYPASNQIHATCSDAVTESVLLAPSASLQGLQA